MDHTDWPSATFVTPAGVDRVDRVVRLRTRFCPLRGHGPIRHARLRVTALGVVEPRVNGRAVGDALLTPGHSSYEWRLRYAEHDVTDMLQDANDLELWLGPGWYTGRLGWEGSRGLYGSRTAAAAELLITYADETVQEVVTDDSWQWAPSPVIRADLYDGQSTDARITEPAAWNPVAIVPTPGARLVPYVGPPVVRQETLAPVKIWRSPSGRLLVDFGQNLVGWVRLRARGSRGTEVTIRHAEVLEHGELGTRPLRSAEATDRMILSGGDDVFEPTFTFHGFRYAQVDGWPGSDEELSRAIGAVVVGSRLRRTGWFRCSDDRINRLHDNIVWSTRGNFLDVPTDCPQRDERLGWTGDISAFAPTAAFLFDVQDFLSDWMADLFEETRHAGGIVPYVVPDVLKLEPKAPGNTVFGSPHPTALWGDAAVWVPWALYQDGGDLHRLAQHYPAMTLHCETVEQVLSADGVWETGFQFGDWLDPTAPPDDPAAAMTPTALVATACAFRSFSFLAEAASALDMAEDAARFRRLADRVRAGFLGRWATGGNLRVESATGYAIAIAFGLFADEDLTQAGARLADLVQRNDYRIATGFAGTPYVTDALTRTGYIADAYRLLLQTERPSWLYPVTMGATTVWERWDSMLPDGTINSGHMTSFNHYAFGSVADWMHRTVGGIAPGAPGYGTVDVAPRPGPGIDWSETRHETTHGPVAVRWEVESGALTVEIDSAVPGTLRLPGVDPVTFAAGVHTHRFAWDVERCRVAEYARVGV